MKYIIQVPYEFCNIFIKVPEYLFYIWITYRFKIEIFKNRKRSNKYVI